MIKNQIYPASISYLNDISQTAINLSKNNIDNKFILDDIKELSNLLEYVKKAVSLLEIEIKKAQDNKTDYNKAAYIWKDNVVSLMNKIRIIIDTIESKISDKYWPIPTYTDLLFSL